MQRYRLLGLLVVLTLVFSPAAIAQEGKTYKTSLKSPDFGRADICVTFSTEHPGVMTIVDSTGVPKTAIWGHWANGKSKKWFVATSDMAGDYFGLTGKMAGKKKIKGDLIQRSNGQIQQARFIGKLDANCSVARPR
jgi:hypothetical protein